ncbi:MAG: hypothetical protein KKB13_15605 [Chloroflexi bacterium]|nr:hypothetical protein [Chloroflexota bacterium]
MKPRSTQTCRLLPALLMAFGVLAALLVPVALAAPSGPDNSFGTNGLVLTNFSNGDDIARDLALQPDGKIVVAGYAHNGQNDDWAVARYNPDGSLDAAFGAGGIVTTTFGNSDEWAYGVALQPDGKIVVAGTARVSDTLQGVYDLALARYDSTGALDTTFGGGDGKVTTDPGEGWNDFGYAVVLQSDKIVVVGATLNLDGSRIALARYNSDGSLDATFNGGGLAAAHYDCEAHAVALQSNDWIVVAGMCFEGGGRDFGLARFDPTGYPDTTFGANGLVLTNIDVDDVAFDVAIQPDGQIIVAGDSGYWDGGCERPQDLALARYSSIDGSLDPTFGMSGVVTTDLGLEQPGLCNGKERGYAAALQPDGKIVVGGSTGAGSSLPGYADDFILVRYNPGGSLDAAFGVGGAIISPVMLTVRSAARAVAIQPDGKFIIAGWMGGDTSIDFFVARYHASFAVYLPLVLRGS